MVTIRATNLAGTDDWTFAYTIVAAPVVALTLSDWIQPAATELEFAALLERTESGNILYRNTDRNGTDVPIEGDINLGANDTEISQIQWNTNRFIFNDNDDPAALSLEAYFRSGGNGNDLTLHVQTLDEGPASFDVATYYPGDVSAGINFIQFGAGTALPAAFVTVVDDIAVGDRWIVAATRAVTTVSVPVFTDDTGAAQSWTVGTTITNVTVPAASGNPAPAYAVVGSLPAGIQFNITTRVISGAPTVTGSGTITIRATNSQGSDDWTVAYSTTVALTVPSFADNTGDAQSWSINTPITSLTVPEATGNPAPAYATVGALPPGLQFNTNTRVLSGTPTTAGSGTITIRATNNQGSDDWTVTYAIAGLFVFTEQDIILGVWIFSGSGQTIYTPTDAEGALNSGLTGGNSSDVELGTWRIYDNGDLEASLSGGTDTLSTVVEVQEDGFTLSAPGIPSVTFDGPNHPNNTRLAPNEPYRWGPDNAADVLAFLNALTDSTVVTLTIRNGLPQVAPVFVDDTGDAQSWTVGTPITDVTVPAATGAPAPTYAVVGSLPDGLQFNTTSRALSGTPTTGDSGTIRIRATNSQGSDDWTVAYAIISLAALAGEVPAPESTLTAESAYSLTTLVAEVPAPESTLTAESAYAVGQLAGEVPAPESTLTAEVGVSIAALVGEVPAPEATLTPESAYSVATLAGEVPAPESTLTPESAYAVGVVAGEVPSPEATLTASVIPSRVVRLGAACGY